MDYDIIIIGAGPAGYVAAIRAGQLGMKTALIEKENVGGMCLNWGCIPTKAILESAKIFEKSKRLGDFGIDGIDNEKINFNWKKVKTRSTGITKRLTAGIKFLLKKNNVELISGEAIIGKNKTVSVDNRSFTAENIIIATGSHISEINSKIKTLPALDVSQLFSLDEIPENIVVFGNTIHSVELAQFFKLIGKNVNLAFEEEKFLPYIDEYLKAFIQKKLKSEKIEILNNFLIDKFENGNIFCKEKEIKCDLIINCNKRNAVIPKFENNLKINDKGFIETNESFKTNIDGVFAIGEVNGKGFLAHLVSAQGLWIINKINGVQKEFNQSNYPINFYTLPEISQIGLTEQELKDKNIEYKISEFPLSANGKAMIEGNTEGLVRILSEVKYGQVMGVQIIAEHATDMISEAAAYMQIEGTVYDIAQTIHAHPTVSEVFMEAGFEGFDKAIHK